MLQIRKFFLTNCILEQIEIWGKQSLFQLKPQDTSQAFWPSIHLATCSRYLTDRAALSLRLRVAAGNEREAEEFLPVASEVESYFYPKEPVTTDGRLTLGVGQTKKKNGLTRAGDLMKRELPEHFSQSKYRRTGLLGYRFDIILSLLSW